MRKARDTTKIFLETSKYLKIPQGNTMKDFLKFLTEAKQETGTGSLEFFDKRLAGAKKLSAQAKEKGGPSILTHYHFAAKIKQYEAVEQAIRQNKDVAFFESKYRNLLSQLQSLNMTQRQFQALSGELEVWGEAIVQLFPRRKS